MACSGVASSSWAKISRLTSSFSTAASITTSASDAGASRSVVKLHPPESGVNLFLAAPLFLHVARHAFFELFSGFLEHVFVYVLHDDLVTSQGADHARFGSPSPRPRPRVSCSPHLCWALAYLPPLELRRAFFEKSTRALFTIFAAVENRLGQALDRQARLLVECRSRPVW